jgi:hypothetical protein
MKRITAILLLMLLLLSSCDSVLQQESSSIKQNFALQGSSSSLEELVIPPYSSLPEEIILPSENSSLPAENSTPSETPSAPFAPSAGVTQEDQFTKVQLLYTSGKGNYINFWQSYVLGDFFFAPTNSSWIKINLETIEVETIDSTIGDIILPDKLKEEQARGGQEFQLAMSEDLNYILFTEQTTDAAEPYENGVWLYNRAMQTTEKVLPEGRYYYSLKFVDEGKQVFAECNAPLEGGGREYLLYNIENNTPGSVGLERDFGRMNILAFPYILFTNGLYDIGERQFTSINLPSNEYGYPTGTVTTNGNVYYFKDGGLKQFSRQTNTENDCHYQLPPGTQNIWWIATPYPDKLLAAFDDSLYLIEIKQS